MMSPGGGPNSPQRRRVAILTAAPLSRNPRAFKEAESLARAGFDVVVYGASFDADQLRTDGELADRHSFSFRSVMPGGEGGAKQTLPSISSRIRTRAGIELSRYFHIENAWQLGPSVVELAKQARKARADYYIAHLEQGVWVGVQLRRSSSSVGIDMEDWYSEDLLPEARKSRPLRLLRNLEKELLTTCFHATCPSRAMSEALAKDFGCPQPAVVYNAFPWSDRESIDGLFRDRQKRCVPSIHWFSQTIGHGRGLDDLIAALPLLKHAAEIHLRGNPVTGFEKWLAERVPEAWRGRIMVHGLVPTTKLLSRITEHDIGFAGETPTMRSRDLTITNKILHYLLGGLAVVASGTAGQREVAEQAPGGVFLYPAGDAPALAARLNTLLESSEALTRAKNAARDAAKRTFCWERQEKTLLESIRQGFSRSV